MQLKQPFLQLPIRFDAASLAAEVRALPKAAWTPHPTGFVGNEAVRLVTPNGQPTDAIEGPMAATEWLEQCDYIREIMAHLGAVWGRSRLMGLAAGREVPPHIDINYYWRTHLRIHIPVITNPDVLFTCGGETVHMEPGSCWVFDSFRWHDVQNKGSEHRVHLVLDTVGGGMMPDLIEAAEDGGTDRPLIAPGKGRGGTLAFEKLNSPRVMTPWEMRCHFAFIREQVDSSPAMDKAIKRIDRFIDEWAALWARFGTDPQAHGRYSKLINDLRIALSPLAAENLMLRNEVPLFRVLDQLVLQVALAPEQPADSSGGTSQEQERSVPQAQYREKFERPIFIVSTPRSGSTLLYETLEKAPGVYSVGGESHWIIEDIPGLTPGQKGWDSNRLNGFDATPQRAEQLANSFYEKLRDRDGNPAKGKVRMLEKTPKNALRVPFFNVVWPDGEFVYLYRDARQTLYSMMEAWHSGGFRTYPQLPGWQGMPWSLLLVPGWRELNGLQLPQIVAHQWAITTDHLLNDLEQLPSERVHAIDYADLVASPQAEMERLAKALGLDWDQDFSDGLPLSKTTVSKPKSDKWRRIESTIDAIWPIVEQADERARKFLELNRVSVAAAA